MKTNNWENKLVDLIEEEIELASGVKSKKHFSGDCKMNDILELVRKTRQDAQREALEKVIKPKLEYCLKQNGLRHCKNCGLSEDDLNLK